MALVKSDDTAKLLIRVALGVVVLFHGVAKLTHGVEWIKGLLGDHGIPGFIAYGVYLAELVAPVLIIVGYRTRIAALVVAFDLSMAILLVLRHQIFSVKEMGGGWAIEVEAFILLASLALFFSGGGKFSITRGRNAWD